MIGVIKVFGMHLNSTVGDAMWIVVSVVVIVVLVCILSNRGGR